MSKINETLNEVKESIEKLVAELEKCSHQEEEVDTDSVLNFDDETEEEVDEETETEEKADIFSELFAIISETYSNTEVMINAIPTSFDCTERRIIERIDGLSKRLLKISRGNSEILTALDRLSCMYPTKLSEKKFKKLANAVEEATSGALSSICTDVNSTLADIKVELKDYVSAAVREAVKEEMQPIQKSMEEMVETLKQSTAAKRTTTKKTTSTSKK